MRRTFGLCLALLVSGCATGPFSSWRGNDSVRESLAASDPEERATALLLLTERAEENPELREMVSARAIRAIDEETEALAVRLIAMRSATRLAILGVAPDRAAQALGRRAKQVERDTLGLSSEFWVRIEAMQDLGDLLRAPGAVAANDTVRSEGRDALCAGIRSSIEGEKGERDRDVRIHAARELALTPGLWEEKEVRRSLIEALADEAPDVRHHAQTALVKLAGGNHGPTKADWERWMRTSSETPDEGH